MVFRARALSRRITSLYEEALRPLGLKPTQMNVMTPIAAAGELRLSRVADMIAVEPSTLSRVADVMRRNGWIEIWPDPDDERARLVRLTDEGNRLYAAALPLWREAQHQTRALLGDDGAQLLVELANESLRDPVP
jgi:DNA-binding MarR family transcriptional regulator